jgi:uncharacterized membrane protein YgcG
MKLNYHKLNQSPLLFLLVLTLITSCTVYQNVPDTDGIYSSERTRTRIILDNSKEYQENENQYFTRELERIDGINGTDILTNIDSYSSIEDTINNAPESIYSYNMNKAWGTSDSEQVIINLNLNNVGYGLNNYWNFYDPYYSFGYLNPWNRRAWRFGWRGRLGDPSFWPGYGYLQFPFFNPFFNGMYGYGYFNSRNYYGYGNFNNIYRNYNYGRRNYSYNTLNSRNYTNSRRINNSNRRVTFTNGRSRNTSRDVNVDNLAKRLRFDKNKIKVYSQTKNVPEQSKRSRNVGKTSTTRYSNSSTRTSNNRSNSSRTRSNSSTRSRINNSPRNSSIRSSNFSRGGGSSSGRSSSSSRSSSSRSYSKKRG